MTLHRACSIVLSVFGGLASAGCQRDAQPRPPEVLYGQQECEQCRMIISDERYACGIALDQGDGRIATYAFDDANCLFAFEREHASSRIAARFVHDCTTKQWLDAATTTFLLSDRLQTPMASGVAAAKSRDALEPLQKESGGQFLDFISLRTQFMTPAAPSQGATP